MQNSIAGHGPNIGHGYVKYVVIDEHGQERPPVIFPAMVARASRQVAGALTRVVTIEMGGQHWWTGEDALLSPAPLTMLAQERLSDPHFLPTVVRGALQRLGSLNGAATGICVTGLPATWAQEREKAQLLGKRLREATHSYQSIRVIPEPLGLIYAVLLDNHGEIVGDPGWLSGRIGVVDLGHYTVDIAVIQRLIPLPNSLETFQLGTSRPLGQVRAHLSAVFERELTLYEADQAVRAQRLLVGGQPQPLPAGWDRPLLHNGEALASRLVEAWGRGAELDTILIGGGGAELEPLTAAISRRFPHAHVVPSGQLAIARGYARLARRLASEAR